MSFPSSCEEFNAGMKEAGDVRSDPCLSEATQNSIYRSILSDLRPAQLAYLEKQGHVLAYEPLHPKKDGEGNEDEGKEVKMKRSKSDVKEINRALASLVDNEGEPLISADDWKVKTQELLDAIDFFKSVAKEASKAKTARKAKKAFIERIAANIAASGSLELAIAEIAPKLGVDPATIESENDLALALQNFVEAKQKELMAEI